MSLHLTTVATHAWIRARQTVDLYTTPASSLHYALAGASQQPVSPQSFETAFRIRPYPSHHRRTFAARPALRLNWTPPTLLAFSQFTFRVFSTKTYYTLQRSHCLLETITELSRFFLFFRTVWSHSPHCFDWNEHHTPRGETTHAVQLAFFCCKCVKENVLNDLVDTGDCTVHEVPSACSPHRPAQNTRFSLSSHLTLPSQAQHPPYWPTVDDVSYVLPLSSEDSEKHLSFLSAEKIC